MANRFWVGGGSSTSWAATSNTNWATTSGGANNASVPTTTDVAIFDSNSGSGNSVIGAAIAVQGLECDGNAIGTGTYAGTITHNGFTLTINTGAASSFRLTSGMTYTPASTSSLVAFTNTSGTAQLKSAGKALAAITLSGVGGTTQQQDDLLLNAFQNSTLTITNGVFDCNSHALTACAVSSSNSNVRSFLLGSGLTIGGNISSGGTAWNFSITTSLTFTKNSANLTVLSPTTNIATTTYAFGALTYNNITFNATTTGVLNNITGALIAGALTVNSGNTLSIAGGATYTFSSITATGTQAAPVTLVVAAANGTAATISSVGACTFIWGTLIGLTAVGGGTFAATNAFAFSCTGWAISPPADASSAGIVTAVWTDLLSSSDFSTSSSVGALIEALVNLQYPAGAIGRGTATTGASATSVPTSAFSPTPSASVANQLAGRNVLFDATTTTVALRGQMAAISASSASATPTLTVSGLTATPASGDTFSVI